MPKVPQIAFFRERTALLDGSKIKQLQVFPKKCQTVRYSSKKMDLSDL